MIKNIQYLVALQSVDGLGPMRLKNLLDQFDGDSKLIWETDIKGIRLLKEVGFSLPENVLLKFEEAKKNLDPDKYWEKLEKSGIKILTFFDDNYPKLLKQIYDPPIVLYFRGEIKVEELAIGVVGTRKMTGYGKMVTEKFTKDLVDLGFTIVSGLARGVDSQAHITTVENKGRTIAVLGGGLNQIYPPENIRLAKEIVEKGGAVLSEFPPDHPSLPGNFPARNRIISGLSLAVLVTEAASDSGSLITAHLALEQGRDVFAVPGPINSELSRGPGDLIKDGARLVFEAKEIAEELGIENVKNIKLALEGTSLNDTEKSILDCLGNENHHIDEIGRMLNLNSANISASLLKMEISGLVRHLGGGIYCKSF